MSFVTPFWQIPTFPQGEWEFAFIGVFLADAIYFLKCHLAIPTKLRCPIKGGQIKTQKSIRGESFFSKSGWPYRAYNTPTNLT